MHKNQSRTGEEFLFDDCPICRVLKASIAAEAPKKSLRAEKSHEVNPVPYGKKFSRVYQFKVTLKGSRPPVWRRLEVPETYSFWDLHVAVQDAMDWLDYHLHEFEVKNPGSGELTTIGITEDDFGERVVVPSWEARIQDYVTPENPRANYSYDFGDGWEMQVVLEKILPRKDGVRYPVCTGGKLCAPPEDCGGIGGFYDLIEIMKNPKHPRFREMRQWLGYRFDAADFEVADVEFDDPHERLLFALIHRD